MTVSDGLANRGEALRLPLARLALDRRTLILVACFVAGTLLLRLPSFFEPPWHTDEGIFQAVAQRVAGGGQLYADAWESKPPLFLYVYVAILKLFGAGVLPLHLAVTAWAIGTELALFAVGRRFMPRRLALAAAIVLAVLLGVPFWEGNLAMTETFAVLPTTLAVLCVLKHEERRSGDAGAWLFAAGLLFGVAFLVRQTSAVVALAVVLWLLTSGRAWLRSGAIIGLGSAAAIAPVVAAFGVFGSFHWLWDANVGFFFNYVPSGQELPLHYRPVIVLPLVAAVGALVVYRRRGERPAWGLPALWLVLTLAAALLTGRPYSHYMLQTFPPLALLVALMAPYVRLGWRPGREQAPALALAFSLALLWFAVVTPAFRGHPLAMRYTRVEGYYPNFVGWAVGLKSEAAYNNYFDKRVNLTHRLDETLTRLEAKGETVYVWGEYPWVYPLTGARPATQYTSSFYVLLIPNLDVQLGETLAEADPRFIVVLGDVWPRLGHDAGGIMKRRYENAKRAIDGLIAWRYEQVAAVGRARVFVRTLERPLVTDRPAEPSVVSGEPVGPRPADDTRLEEEPTALR